MLPAMNLQRSVLDAFLYYLYCISHPVWKAYQMLQSHVKHLASSFKLRLKELISSVNRTEVNGTRTEPDCRCLKCLSKK